MRELLFTMAVFALLDRLFCLPLWFSLPIIIIALIYDYFLKITEIRSRSELESFKLFMSKKD
jgi:hypothetical protein